MKYGEKIEVGMYYEGNWVADKEEGEGKIVYPNGDMYTGGF